jgi:drug/metabolite transporter (DMT)-like permease
MMHSATWRKLGIALAVVGVIAVVVGIVYLVVPGKDLPSIMGSQATAHHFMRGATALVAGVLMLGGSVVSFAMVRRRRKRRRSANAYGQEPRAS